MDFSLTSIYVANGLGAVLTAVILAGNLWRVQSRNSENVAILVLLVLTLLNCLVDPCVFTSDGLLGDLPEYVNRLGNAWLYTSNMFCAFLWLFFLTKHSCGGISRTHLNVLIALLVLGSAGIVINAFSPFIYTFDSNNVYQRLWGYWVYTVIDYGMTLDSIVLYFLCRKKSGVLKYFPIWMYLIPLMIGTAVQTMFFGLSLISASLAVSMAGVFSSLQNELIFRDRLTGLYNRVYLDFHLKAFLNLRKMAVTGMMLDMNSFKKINDNFGHSVGDDALVNMAKILQISVGNSGVAIRYAGDEFIILLNTREQSVVDSCINSLNRNLEKFNSSSKAPYKLSVSYGQGLLDLQGHTIDEFIKTLDDNMYESKKAYYATNRPADRRGFCR